MKKILKYFFLFIIASVAKQSLVLAQNLVPNPSFEDTVACPISVDQVSDAIGWSSYKSTPDYFNSCAATIATVPNNQFGYQQPYSGNAYCGFYTFNHSSFYREIIGGQLSSSLIIGQKYFVSFQVVLTAVGQCATDRIGAKFSTVPFSFSSPVPINNSAQVTAPVVITDTLDWTKVSGSFIADSAYDYIMLGNFFDDVNTDTAQITGYQYCTSYYFIDDVCISIDSLTCNPDKGESINEQDSDFSTRVFPNPVSNYLIIENNSAVGVHEVKLCNLFSQSIEFGFSTLSNNKYLLKFNNPSNGIYVLFISYNNKKYVTEKIIIHN